MGDKVRQLGRRFGSRGIVYNQFIGRRALCEFFHREVFHIHSSFLATKKAVTLLESPLVTNVCCLQIITTTKYRINSDN